MATKAKKAAARKPVKKAAAKPKAKAKAKATKAVRTTRDELIALIVKFMRKGKAYSSREVVEGLKREPGSAGGGPVVKGTSGSGRGQKGHLRPRAGQRPTRHHLGSQVSAPSNAHPTSGVGFFISKYFNAPSLPFSIDGRSHNGIF